ncbi:MAG: alpha/beta fold hydrolase [Pseudomonadota bacterium]
MQESALLSIEGPGPRLALRHRPAQGSQRGAILFVHGATLASDLYDVPLPGYSWLAAAAAAGREAYAVDLRGYGRSARPVFFDAPAQAAPPYARASEVLADIDRAVEAVRGATGLNEIDLVGGSWGSVTCSLYASGEGRGKLRRLVLFAPLYAQVNQAWLEICGAPDDPLLPHPNLGAYRWVDAPTIRSRWDAEIPPADKTLFRPEPVFQAIMASSLAADPAGQRREPPAFRVPNGTLVDLHSVFSGKALYDPAAITLPTLLLRGDCDPTSTQADTSRLFEALAARQKHQVTIGGASHFAIGERAAPQVFKMAEAFLSL